MNSANLSKIIWQACERIAEGLCGSPYTAEPIASGEGHFGEWVALQHDGRNTPNYRT